jgi:hypothetical protein
VEELPESIRRGIDIKLAESVSEVVDIVLV